MDSKVVWEKVLMLLGSRKSWIALATIAAIAVLVWFGKVTTQEMLDFYKWIVSAWIASIALESAGTALAGKDKPGTITINTSIEPGKGGDQ